MLCGYMQAGKCIQFDGSSSQYASFSSTDFTPAAITDISFSFWFKFTGSEIQATGKIFSMKSADNYDLSVGKTDEGNNLLVELFGPQGGTTESIRRIIVTAGFTANEAVNFVIVFKRSTNKIQVFRNGAAREACSGTSANNLVCVTEADFPFPSYVFTTNVFAKSQAGTVNYYSGFIDSFGIFPWALSTNQITALNSATTSTVSASIQNHENSRFCETCA
jgi:hypothetical protein